ncbi:hypothetical protein TNCV_1526741 [Trichonephila clavipes]|nr:hypothetical protein TNCV_1526741 [Trichonephila clavipes]
MFRHRSEGIWADAMDDTFLLLRQFKIPVNISLQVSQKALSWENGVISLLKTRGLRLYHLRNESSAAASRKLQWSINLCDPHTDVAELPEEQKGFRRDPFKEERTEVFSHGGCSARPYLARTFRMERSFIRSHSLSISIRARNYSACKSSGSFCCS